MMWIMVGALVDWCGGERGERGQGVEGECGLCLSDKGLEVVFIECQKEISYGPPVLAARVVYNNPIALRSKALFSKKIGPTL